MVTQAEFRQIALSFPDAKEQPHFEKPSFRCKDKIFATLHVDTSRAVLKLAEEDQAIFSKYPGKAFYPVPGAWGKKGWTFVELKIVRKDMLKDAVELAYNIVVHPG